MTTLCLVLDGGTDVLPEPTTASGEDAKVLAFCRLGDLEGSLRAAFRQVAILDVRDRHDEIVADARDRFTRFVGEWPDNYLVGGRSFKQWLTRGGLSLWWFTELSQKNPESSPVFDAYCRARIVRNELRRGSYTSVLIIGGENAASRVLADVCREAGVTVQAHGVRGHWKHSTFGLLMRRLKSAGLAAARWRLARKQAGGQAAVPARGSVAFHTWFPLQWAEWEGKLRDRYFVDLPDDLAGRGARVEYAGAFACLGFRELRKLPSRLRDLPVELRRQFAWIEAGPRLRDIVATYLDVGVWLRFLYLCRADPQLERGLAEGLDVDLSPLLLRDLRLSLAVHVPEYRLLALQIQLFVEAHRPAQLVTVLETYCYGRAVTFGARRAGRGTRVIGLQHSPVNANQLFYRYLPREVSGDNALPLPDQFLLHSRLAKEMLLGAGVAAERLHLVGAPRFSGLAGHREKRQGARAKLRRDLGLPTGGRLLLAAGVIWQEETRDLLASVFEACARLSDVFVAIKPHPAGGDINPLVAALSSQFPGVRWEVVDHPLNALQAAADVMVTGNSTSDVEALAIGCPVVRAGSIGAGSSAVDELEGALVEVASTEELIRAMDSLQGNVGGRLEIGSILGPIDRSINDRIAEVLMPPPSGPEQEHRPRTDTP